MNITTTILVPRATYNKVVLQPADLRVANLKLFRDIPSVAAWDAVDPKLGAEIMHAHCHGEFVKLQIMKP